MEDWERDLRRQLQIDLSEGCYKLGPVGTKTLMLTGKQGRIDYEVELVRHAKKFLNQSSEL